MNPAEHRAFCIALGLIPDDQTECNDEPDSHPDRDGEHDSARP